MKILKTLVAPFIAAALAASAAFAQQIPQITPPAGFSEGTETKLTDVQIVDLVPWAKNSKRDLEELLSDAETIGSPVAKKRALLSGIQNLVLQSQPLKSELLMRYVLNRALVVNTEIENEAITQNGGKAPTGVVDQQIRLLTQSAKMAVKYHESDLDFLNGTAAKKDVNLVSLPYAKFGLEYAEFLMNLNNSVTDSSAQYNIGVIALGLLQWDLYRDQNKVAFSDTITKINGFLKTIPERAGSQDDNQSAVYVRQIKKKFLAAAETVRSRLNELGVTPVSNPAATTKETSTGHVWELVARTESGHEVWKDRTSGLTWSDRLDKNYTHYDAVEVDDKGNVTKEKACVSTESLDARGKITNLSWSLPKIEDYEAAEKHGIREVLPNMKDYWFWSASLYPNDSRNARQFYGDNGYVDNYYRYYGHGSVRCVGR